MGLFVISGIVIIVIEQMHLEIRVSSLRPRCVNILLLLHYGFVQAVACTFMDPASTCIILQYEHR